MLSRPSARKLGIGIATATACAAANHASAVIVFDTITAATFTASSYLRVGEYDPFAGETAAHDYSVSTRITISGDGLWQLTAIAARMSRDADYLGASRARVWISEATDGGGPSQALELGTLATTATVPTTVGIETLAPLNYILQGGRSYWVTMTAVPNDLDPTRIRWYRSSLGAAGSTYSDDLLGAGSWTLTDGLAPGLKLGANAIPAPAPAMALGLAGLLRRRRR